jgi:anti-anti-sigma factor
MTTTRPEPGLVLVTARGEVDLSSSPVLAAELDQALLPPAPAHLAMDLGEVTFISSSGLQVLIEFFQRSELCGTETRLVCVSRPVRRILDLAGLDCILKHREICADSTAVERPPGLRPSGQGLT